MLSLLLQDEKQALHDCVREALAQTQNAAVADRASTTNGQDGDVDVAVSAQIQQRRNQQVSFHVLHAISCAVQSQLVKDLVSGIFCGGCKLFYASLPCINDCSYQLSHACNAA